MTATSVVSREVLPPARPLPPHRADAAARRVAARRAERENQLWERFEVFLAVVLGGALSVLVPLVVLIQVARWVM